VPTADKPCATVRICVGVQALARFLYAGGVDVVRNEDATSEPRDILRHLGESRTDPESVHLGKVTPVVRLPPRAQQCIVLLPDALWLELHPELDEALRGAVHGDLAVRFVLSFGRAQLHPQGPITRTFKRTR
jgi:hypothetical protein